MFLFVKANTRNVSRARAKSTHFGRWAIVLSLSTYLYMNIFYTCIYASVTKTPQTQIMACIIHINILIKYKQKYNQFNLWSNKIWSNEIIIKIIINKFMVVCLTSAEWVAHKQYIDCATTIGYDLYGVCWWSGAKVHSAIGRHSIEFVFCVEFYYVHIE